MKKTQKKEKKKKFMSPFLWMGSMFQGYKATTRRRYTFWVDLGPI